MLPIYLRGYLMQEKQSRLDVLKKKQDQLRAQIQKLESLDKTRERKRDTRRKILIGSYFIDKARDEGALDAFYQQLEDYLKRNSDRELFQLMPLVDEGGLESVETLKGV